MVFETIGAVYGTIVARLEGNLRILAAFGANNVVHRAVLAVTAAGTSGITAPRVAVCGSAGGAAAGFVSKSFLGEEGLL